MSGEAGADPRAPEPEAPHARFDVDGHVATVTLDRPRVKNALSGEMLVRMADAWARVDTDPGIRVVIVTGAGGDFCAGADLREMAGGYGETEWTQRFRDDPELHWKALLRTGRPRKPIVAAVEGCCVAGGVEILQAMDIRVAGESATFGVAEVRRGIFPLGGSTVRLSRQIPYTVAADMLLTGRTITAREAKDAGLVGHLVPDGTALAAARDLAGQVAANGPLAVQAVLRSLRETRELPEEEALALELEIGTPVYATNDAREGPLAFREKRPPHFTGT